MFLCHFAGQKNYVFFMVLLVGFITTETFYAVCSSQCKYKLDDTRIVNLLAVNLQENPVIHLDV